MFHRQPSCLHLLVLIQGVLQNFCPIYVTNIIGVLSIGNTRETYKETIISNRHIFGKDDSSPN